MWQLLKKIEKAFTDLCAVPERKASATSTTTSTTCGWKMFATSNKKLTFTANWTPYQAGPLIHSFGLGEKNERKKIFIFILNYIFGYFWIFATSNKKLTYIANWTPCQLGPLIQSQSLDAKNKTWFLILMFFSLFQVRLKNYYHFYCPTMNLCVWLQMWMNWSEKLFYLIWKSKGEKAKLKSTAFLKMWNYFC